MPARRGTSAPPQPFLRRHWRGLAGGIGAGVLAAGLLGYTYHALTQPGRLPLRVVEINGNFNRLDRDDIRETVRGAMDGGFLTVDMAAVRRAVRAMPWVAEVSIRRVWPDRLQMHVTEEQPLARWGEDALINTGARVFRPKSLAGHEGMPRLRGPDGSETRVVDFYRAVAPSLAARGLQLQELALDERRHWWLHLNEDLVVSLGREHLEERLAQFLRVYPSLAADDARRPVRIDMRYAHGFAVRWQQRAPAEADAAHDQAREEA
jgi:cell division protein FtsQ